MEQYLKDKCRNCSLCSLVTKSISGALLTPYHQCLANLASECYEDGCMYSFILNNKTFDSKEEYKIALSDYFMDKWTDGNGFMTILCVLLTKADFENLDKLVLVYPDLVNGYSVYAYGKLYCELHKSY